MQPLGVIPLRAGPGISAAGQLEIQVPTGAAHSGCIRAFPGGVQSGPAVSPSWKRTPSWTLSGELLQHLAGEVIGAIRSSKYPPLPVRSAFRPAAGASGFGEPAASA